VGEAEAQLAVARLKVRELEEEKEEQQRQRRKEEKEKEKKEKGEGGDGPPSLPPSLSPSVVEVAVWEEEVGRLKEMNVALRREVERGKVREGGREEGRLNLFVQAKREGDTNKLTIRHSYILPSRPPSLPPSLAPSLFFSPSSTRPEPI